MFNRRHSKDDVDSDESPQLQETPTNKGSKGPRSMSKKVTFSFHGINSYKTPKEVTPVSKGKTAMQKIRGRKGNNQAMKKSKSDQHAAFNSLSDSGYIGKQKINTPPIEHSKRLRMISSPLSKPTFTTTPSVATCVIETPCPVNKFSKEKIKKTKNVPDPDEDASSSSMEYIEFIYTRADTNSNDSFFLTESSEQSGNEIINKAINEIDSNINENDYLKENGGKCIEEGNDESKKAFKELDCNVNEKYGSNTKDNNGENLVSSALIEVITISDDSEDEKVKEFLGEKIEKFSPYTDEIIESCSNYPLLFAIYNGLKTELEENKEKERLMKKCHDKMKSFKIDKRWYFKEYSSDDIENAINEPDISERFPSNTNGENSVSSALIEIITISDEEECTSPDISVNNIWCSLEAKNDVVSISPDANGKTDICLNEKLDSDAKGLSKTIVNSTMNENIMKKRNIS